ncbi:tRNA dihydrouridine(20/20a) synthase DusA [Amphibiibacter pelophylacis]|uniref:tRNA dihydrouridine(20/20a) synthase DusA n=1 Tax=Amphibiibacter pelophylacis TaxID=1799477 RepID=A0ACC6P4X7_9BURK
MHQLEPFERPSPWRLAVAPMLDWTDRHCRYFHRLITRRTRLYTEMVTTGALLHGDQGRHLDFDTAEHPVALQLGGSEPADLAACAALAQRWGYDEVNLNCGCPSPRVQRGAFGACLMGEADLVARGVDAMRQACDLPVTVKHRIGIDRQDSYGFVRDFVGTVAQAGCSVFIVHARSAWLDGLSPKDNREIPPLRYETVYRLKREFPHLTLVLNGGVADNAAIAQHLAHVDGVMVGRAAYHQPWLMADWDDTLWRDPAQVPCAADRSDAGQAADLARRRAIEAQMVDYMARQLAAGADKPHPPRWPAMARHMLGLYHGVDGARRWRQAWSDSKRQNESPQAVFESLHGASRRG